jgi:hypothetical protein
MASSPSPFENKFWTEDEDKILIDLRRRGYSYREIGGRLNRTFDSVRERQRRLDGRRGAKNIIPDSIYPRYDTPLEMEGDAVVLPDIEAPFQHAEFFNRVLDLADAWQVKQAIVAGDLLHFDSITAWEANWVERGNGGLSEIAERKLMNAAMSLPAKHQEEMMNAIVNIGGEMEDGDPNISQELRAARKCVTAMADCFDNIDFVLGNHDGRFLRTIGSSMFPEELLRLVDQNNPKWRIAPYYYSYLMTETGKYQIEHPKTYAKNSPVKLAAKYQCHILQAHSHKWLWDVDPSGTYYAIHMGCIVDEMRLPYAAQRHNTSEAHLQGAVIVRNGYPYLLGDRTPWDDYKKMR